MIPRARRLAAAFAITGCLLAPVGCSGSDDDAESSTALQQVAPTKADVARDAGIEFPPSTADFRLVRIDADQIDVTFTARADEVDGFTTGSGIPIEAGRRTITHASPLWDVAVNEAVRGGSSRRDGLVRNVEVIGGGDAGATPDATATVRLSIVRATPSTDDDTDS